MPTPDELDRQARLRGLFLNALWDDLHSSRHSWGEVHQILPRVPELAQISPPQIDTLLHDLKVDGLIEAMRDSRSYDDKFDPLVRLTAVGNREVEQWVRQGTSTTAHLPISYNQTINNNNTNTFLGSVSGSTFVSGSSNVTVNQNTTYGQALHEIATKVEELLAVVDADADEREDVEVAVATVREAAASDSPDGKVRSALRWLSSWSSKAVAAGANAALSTEVQQLISHVLPQLG